MNTKRTGQTNIDKFMGNQDKTTKLGDDPLKDDNETSPSKKYANKRYTELWATNPRRTGKSDERKLEKTNVNLRKQELGQKQTNEANSITNAQTNHTANYGTTNEPRTADVQAVQTTNIDKL